MRLTKHVKEQMVARNISEELVREALERKALKHNKDANKRVYHGPKGAHGKHVFVVADVVRGNVITTYWLG